MWWQVQTFDKKIWRLNKMRMKIQRSDAMRRESRIKDMMQRNKNQGSRIWCMVAKIEDLMQRNKNKGSRIKDLMQGDGNQGALQAFVALVLWRALGRPLATWTKQQQKQKQCWISYHQLGIWADTSNPPFPHLQTKSGTEFYIMLRNALKVLCFDIAFRRGYFLEGKGMKAHFNGTSFQVMYLRIDRLWLWRIRKKY